MDSDEGGAKCLEQFTILAKTARGRSMVALIQQVLSSRNIYVVGELLDMPHVVALEKTEFQPYLDLLKIFAYGTVKTYQDNKDNLPAVTPLQLAKLRKLTIVSMCQESRMVSYDSLIDTLGISNVRDLEDIIIETIYAGLIQARLDQRRSQLLVKHAISRDIRPNDMDRMMEKLKMWSSTADSLCRSIDEKLRYARLEQEKKKQQEKEIASRIDSISENLRQREGAKAHERATSMET